MKRILIQYVELLMDLKNSGIEVEFIVISDYIEGRIEFVETWRFDYYLTEDEFKCFRHNLLKRKREHKAILESEIQLAL